jgi:8-oxo-dGTP diphosphatase
VISCIFENGNKTSLRHVTVNAIVVKDNKVLLGKRGTLNGKPILESGKWALLGGFFGRDEDLVKAVEREVMEESGWEIDNVQLFRINDSPKRPKEDRQNVDIVFIAKGIKQIKTSDEEVKKLEWFDLDNLPPKNFMAFDHGEDLDLYIRYLNNKRTLPILG